MSHQEPSAIDPKLLNVSELASIFHCDPETVKRQARSGRLPGFKFGKFWFFRWQDINSMINNAIPAAYQAQA